MYDEEKRSVYADEPERATSKLPLTNQEKVISELHDCIGQLTSRLKPVLTPVPEADRSTAIDKELPSQSPLGEQLDANNRGISSATRKLRDLMDRVEC